MGIMHNGRTDKRSVIKRSMNKALPHDDLDGAFAGEENAEKRNGSGHSTNVKSRKTQKSKARDKVR